MRQKRASGVESTSASILTLKLFQALAGLALLAGLVQRQRELILLSALALAAVNAARLWCLFSTRGLSFRAAVSRRRLYPGEDLVLTVQAENGKLLPVWVRAEVPDSGASGPLAGPAGLEPELREPLLAGESGLLAFQRIRWQRELAVARRGVYELGPVRLEAGDLLGFFRRRERDDTRLEVLVYPRLVPLAPLPLPVREFFGLQRARTPVEDPVCHVGTRDYHGSRPARHIHWKASARLARLQEKLNEPTSQAGVLFLLDAASFSAPGGAGGEEPFERTLEVVASLAVEFERARLPVGLAANGLLLGAQPAMLAPGRGPYQVARLLEVLARLTPRPDRVTGHFSGRGLRVGGTTTCLYVCRSLACPGPQAVRALQYRLRLPLVVLPAEPSPEPSLDDPAAVGLPVVRLAGLRAGPPRGASHG
jgi:uncharacterized protein (DUF58 family)